MARTYDTQPMAKNPDALTIGTMKLMANEIDVTTKNFIDESTGADTGITADSSTIPTYLTSQSLGALQNAGFEATPEFVEHQAGYPKKTDVKIPTATSCNWKADMEELISAKGLYFLRKIVDSLNTGQLNYFAVGGYSQQVSGNLLKFYTPIAQLKPELNLKIGNEWGAFPLALEAVYRDDFVNKELIYYSRDVSITDRDIAYQPITVDTEGLVIGKMQVRVGKWARRGAGTATIFPARKVVGAVDTTMPLTSGGTYTGNIDGGYVIEILTGGVPDGTTAGAYEIFDLDGTSLGSGWIPTDGSAVAVGSAGVTVVFSATYDYTAGDKYVIGVETASALDSSATNIACPYPYLPVDYSVGALATTEITSNITYKDHYSGFPEKKTLSVLEKSEVQFNAAIEEIAPTGNPTTAGYATGLADAVIDASITGVDYYAPVEIVITGAFGRTLHFWIPNAQLIPSANFNPSDDWANLQVGFLAAQQAGVNMFDFIYRS